MPAWPMPIHQTKLTMANPQPIGNVDAPDADARHEQVGHGHQQQHHQQKADSRNPKIHHLGVRRVRTMALILSVTEAKL